MPTHNKRTEARVMHVVQIGLIYSAMLMMWLVWSVVGNWAGLLIPAMLAWGWYGSKAAAALLKKFLR